MPKVISFSRFSERPLLSPNNVKFTLNDAERKVDAASQLGKSVWLGQAFGWRPLGLFGDWVADESSLVSKNMWVDKLGKRAFYEKKNRLRSENSQCEFLHHPDSRVLN